MRDVHALREHYVLTVAGWLENFRANRDRLVALVGEEVVRVWELYLVGGSMAFRDGRMGVDQILMVRPDGPAHAAAGARLVAPGSTAPPGLGCRILSWLGEVDQEVVMAAVCRYLRQNVLGLVAIFIALSGSAYAVTAAKNSVGSAAIQNGSVRGVDLHSKAVSAKKLKLPSVLQVLQSRVTGSCTGTMSIQGIAADGSVVCVAGQVGSGDITKITTAGGLTGGADAGDVALGVDPSAIQSRVTGTCAGTSILQSIAQNGTVGCTAIPSDAAAGTPSLRTLGTGPGQAVANNDPRLTDTRTPTDGSVTPAKLAALPGGRMTQTGTCQTVGNGGFPQLTFNGLESWGPGHDVTFNDAADSLTVHTAGTYLVTAYVEWPANGTGDRALGGSRRVPPRPTASTPVKGPAARVPRASPPPSWSASPPARRSPSTSPRPAGCNLTLQDLGANCASLGVQWISP